MGFRRTGAGYHWQRVQFLGRGSMPGLVVVGAPGRRIRNGSRGNLGPGGAVWACRRRDPAGQRRDQGRQGLARAGWRRAGLGAGPRITMAAGMPRQSQSTGRPSPGGLGTEMLNQTDPSFKR